MKRLRSFFALLLMLVMVATTSTPALAASGDVKVKTVSKIEAAWTKSTEMVDFADSSWAEDWVEWMLDQAGATSANDMKKARALYDATIKYASYDANKTSKNSFMQCMREVAVYANDPKTSVPKWQCGDYARFLVGMLRIADIPAYIELGYVSADEHYHARVVVVNATTKKAYWLDPCYADKTGLFDRYFQMTEGVYDSGYRYEGVASELKKPPATDPGETTKPMPDPTPTYPNSGKVRTVKVNSVLDSWKASTLMVNWAGSSWAETWVNWILEDAGVKNSSDSKKARALFDALVRYGTCYDVSSESTNYDYLKCMEQFAVAVDAKKVTPAWHSDDAARFLVGMLRNAGIPAYIELGYVGANNHTHARVVMLDRNDMQKYWLDPCMADESGNSDKYFKMTEKTYAENYIYQKDYYEGAEITVSVKPKPVTRQEASIVAANRLNGGQAEIKLTVAGKAVSVKMATVKYDGEWWFPARDVAKLWGYTTVPLSVTWNGDMDTIEFSAGKAIASGEEISWTQTVNKTAKAYILSNAYYGGKTTNVKVILIDGLSFVRIDDIVNMTGMIGGVK